MNAAKSKNEMKRGMFMKKSISALFLALIMMFSCLSFTAFMENGEDSDGLNCKNAIVINTNTGRTVFEKNADEPVAIASLTKVMTALVVIENCEDLDALVETKLSSLLAIGNTGLVTINLVSGEKMSVRDMLYCLLIHSAADASVVLADYIGGSIENFVEMMNKKAQELSMTNTHFVNTHGLDAEGHYSTARDLAVLTMYALKNEIFSDIVSKSTYTTEPTNMNPSRTVSTTNYLLMYNSGFYYEKADGVKTGYTEDAGRCLIASATDEKTQYVCVVLGCDAYNDNGTMACKHFSDSISLFENAFNSYSLKKAAKKGSEVVKVPVKCFGIDAEAQGVYKNNFTYLLAKGEKVETKINLDSELIKKPVKAGDKLGTCDIILDGTTLKTVDIVAKEDVSRDTTKIAITVLIWALVILLAAAAVVAIIFFIGRKPKGKGGQMKRNVKYK